MASASKACKVKPRNIKNLTLPSPTLASKPASSAADAQVPGSRASRNFSSSTAQSVNDTIKPTNAGKDLSEQMATLEIGVEFKLDLRAEDLKTIERLGAGNGGTVSKVEHIPTKTIMAKKVVHVERKPAVRKQILRELQIMHDCSSPYIVSFYGAFMFDMEICLCMEYMDCGSLDRISKTIGAIPVDIMAKITHAVLSGLTYLYQNHQIIHRDVKPSNILLAHTGALKLCDFGVSGELINSIADTFVGTSTYMSPERIQASPYTVKSDVWSLGITLLELGGGQYPWGSGNTGVLELLQQIVHESPPKLPEGKDYQGLDVLIERCLVKDPNKRPRPEELLKDPFVVAGAEKKVDLAKWAQAFVIRKK